MSFFSKGKERRAPAAPVEAAPPPAAPSADPARDPLTGLLSNDALVDACRSAVEAANGGEHVAVAYFSFDGLRELNARAGHLVTDKLLRELGQRLRDTVRECDHVGRISGDEFLVIMRQMGSRLETLAFMARLRVALAAPIAAGNGFVPIVNFGLAHPPVDGSTLEALSGVAEKAMLAMREQARAAARENAQKRVIEMRAALAAASARVAEAEQAVRDADAALVDAKRLVVDAKAAVAASLEHAKSLGVTPDAAGGPPK